VLGRLDNPDEEDAAHSDGAGGVACDQVAHEGDLVRYPHPAGEEEDGAVGVEDVRAAVGAFD